jgi:hypothetical protein
MREQRALSEEKGFRPDPADIFNNNNIKLQDAFLFFFP